MVRARERMIPYMPYRNYGSFVDAIEQGTDLQNAVFNIRLPYARKLYYGVAASGKEINYTKRPHPMAGPYWDRRMMQNEQTLLVNEIQAYKDNNNG